MSESFDDVRKLCEECGRIVAFTGAGISKESGIPTYRGQEDGIWSKYDPSKYADIDFFHSDPTYYWSFFREVRYPLISEAEPNRGHLALRDLERSGKLSCVITQNIDGLHQAAGSKRVLELHGNTRRILCLGCAARYDWEEIYRLLDRVFPPLCPACGGELKPDVVFFGEMLPQAVLEEAFEESRSCDLMLAVGSSLVVYPAAHIPATARAAGASLVIVNYEPTALDAHADYVLQGKAGDILPRILPGRREPE